MYYLFIKKEKDIHKYMEEFNRVKRNRDEGKAPVFSELRGAKTSIIESIPYNLIAGVLIILGSIFADKIGENAIIKIAIVMVVNNFCYATANYIFTILKHKLRINLCKRLKIEPSEENIAIMESLEYQTI